METNTDCYVWVLMTIVRLFFHLMIIVGGSLFVREDVKGATPKTALYFMSHPFELYITDGLSLPKTTVSWGFTA